MDYKNAGVDIEAGYRSVELMVVCMGIPITGMGKIAAHMPGR